MFVEPLDEECWRVHYDGPYEWSEPPHVRVGCYNMHELNPGDMYQLTNLHVSEKREDGPGTQSPEMLFVRWKVTMCPRHDKKGLFASYFTVYAGPDAGAKLASLQ